MKISMTEDTHAAACDGQIETPGETDPAAETSLLKRLAASGALRFAGWWTIFASLLAINSICPICGGTSCPVGIGATGILAGLLAGFKQYGRSIIGAAVRLFRPHTAIEAHAAPACADPACACHRHGTQHASHAAMPQDKKKH